MKYSLYILSVMLLGVSVFSCKKTGENSGISVNAVGPSVTTADASNITGTSATIGGTVTTDGGSLLKESGVVYSTTPNVDTTKNKTPFYSAGGPFSVQLKNLSLLTPYYYRAYAINEKGLVYGAEKTFTVPVPGYTFSSQIAAANQVAYWAFNSSYIDSVSKTVGTPNHATAISFVPGILGQAVQVKSPGYINTNVASTIAGLKTFSMVFWTQQPASLTSGPTTYMPFSLNQAGYSWEQTKLFMLFDQADNATNSYAKVGLMDQWFDKGKVWPRMLDTKWHQTAITFDGGTGAMRIYVDGTLLSQSSGFSVAAQNNFGTADSFTLGGPDDNANTANGWMNSLSGNLDEFRVYNKVLSAEEVLYLYTLQVHGF